MKIPRGSLSGNETIDRAEALAVELRRVAHAHTDSLGEVDAGAVESMALAMALCDLLREALVLVTGSNPDAATLDRTVRTVPFRAAADIVARVPLGTRQLKR